METIDLETAGAVGGGLTLAGFPAALALSGPAERDTSGAGWDTAGD